MSNSVENDWWAPIRIGLFADPSGKHYQRMGPAIWLYGYLHAGADWRTGKLERKYETIHAETGISIRNLQRMMNQLKKFGYVEVIRKSQSMVVMITKWRPIKIKKTSAKNGGTRDQRTANNGGSNESLYLNPNIYTAFEEDWTNYPRKAGSKKKALQCYKKTVGKNLEKLRPQFQTKMDAYVQSVEDQKYLKHGETFFRNWEDLEIDPVRPSSKNNNHELYEQFQTPDERDDYEKRRQMARENSVHVQFEREVGIT